MAEQLSGVLSADFSAFYAAVDKAEADLRGLEQTGASAGSALGKMAAFDGKPVAAGLATVAAASQNVTQSQEEMLDAIGVAGGRLSDLRTTATTASPAINTLSESYKQFDGVLQAAGINIGPFVKGLDEIAGVAGKTTAQIGLLGTAGLTAGAALTGWKIGRWIDELTGASSAVEALTRNILGLGNAQTEALGAKQDTINRAIALGAKETITYAEAIKFLNEHTRQAANANIDWTEKLASAHREVRQLTDEQIRGIKTAQEAGASVQQITDKYHVSARALDVLTDRTKVQADMDRKAAEARKAQLAELAKLEKDYAKLRSDIANEAGVAQMNSDAAAMKWISANVEATKKAKIKAAEETRAAEEKTEAARLIANQAEIDAQQAVLAQQLQTNQAHVAGGRAAVTAGAEATAAYGQVAQQVTLTGDAVREYANLLRHAEQANAILAENSLFTTISQRERIAALPPAGGSSATSVVNNFTLTDTESNLARKVSDLIMQTIRSGTQLGAT